MPNWTSNRIEAPAEVLKKYISKDEDGKDCFDFNLVIPRPEIYNDPELVSGGHQEDAIYCYRSEKGTRKPQVIGKQDGSLKGRILFGKINGIGYKPSDLSRYENLDELYEIGRKYMNVYEEYGYLDWYDWSAENWGTKWNACDSCCDFVDDGWVEFETAWCMPKPIIEKIMADNPGCRISITWSDEDYNGTHTLERDEDGSYSETTIMRYEDEEDE